MLHWVHLESHRRVYGPSPGFNLSPQRVSSPCTPPAVKPLSAVGGGGPALKDASCGRGASLSRAALDDSGSSAWASGLPGQNGCQASYSELLADQPANRQSPQLQGQSIIQCCPGNSFFFLSFVGQVLLPVYLILSGSFHVKQSCKPVKAETHVRIQWPHDVHCGPPVHSHIAYLPGPPLQAIARAVHGCSCWGMEEMENLMYDHVDLNWGYLWVVWDRALHAGSLCDVYGLTMGSGFGRQPPFA